MCSEDLILSNLPHKLRRRWEGPLNWVVVVFVELELKAGPGVANDISGVSG